MKRLVSALLGLALVLGAPGRARAEGDEHYLDGLSFIYGGTVGTLHLEDVSISAPKNTSPVLENADLRLHGGTTMVGGAFGILYVTHGLRFAFDEAIVGASGLSLRHAPLENGYGASGSRAYGLLASLAFGKQFHFDGVHPYADLRVGISDIGLSVSVDVPGVGSVGQNDYRSIVPVVAPRIGAALPLTRYAFLDASGDYSILGHQGIAVRLAIGVFLFDMDRH